MLLWQKHMTSLTLSYKQTVTANEIVAIAQIHRRTVNVYSFLSVGATYSAMGKVVACRTLFISNIDVAMGVPRGHGPLKFLDNIVILCFERRFSKQNSVIRLKSNILPPPKFLGWQRH